MSLVNLRPVLVVTVGAWMATLSSSYRNVLDRVGFHHEVAWGGDELLLEERDVVEEEVEEEEGRIEVVLVLEAEREEVVLVERDVLLVVDLIELEVVLGVHAIAFTRDDDTDADTEDEMEEKATASKELELGTGWAACGAFGPIGSVGSAFVCRSGFEGVGRKRSMGRRRWDSRVRRVPRAAEQAREGGRTW